MKTRGKSSGRKVVDEQKKGKSNASVIGSKAKLVKKEYEEEFVDIENRSSDSDNSPPPKLHRPSQESDSLSHFQTPCSTRHIYRQSNTLKEEKKFTTLTKMNFDDSLHWQVPHKRHFSEEMPNSSSRSEPLTESRDHNFSLTSHLDDDGFEDMTCSERLVNALKDGNLLAIGRIIRNGISSGTLSEVSLMEISKQTEPPKVPLMMNLLANENADLEDMKSYNAASIFLQNFPSGHEKPLKRLQKSVNSLTYSLKDGSSLDDIQNKSLDAFHIIKKSGFFLSFDLNKFYSSYVLIGEGAINQLISMLVQIFRKMTCPIFEIWKVAFYPRSNKNVDGNFVELPEEIFTEIQDFCYDVLGCYLPDDLLYDPIDTSHEFLQRLGEDPIKELRRRRTMRQTTTKSVLQGIWQGLRTVRSYHFDVKKGELISCQGRKNCVKHIKWEQLKRFRERLQNNNEDPDDYTIDQLLQHVEQFPNTPRTDNRARY